ncbi:ShlB/FhaC/HecB family hemolysin secretion/activation protein [Inhella proteolytica]|uniref:ShlB/FhaC/HecB family hemolysin secretion/activation protein n=1 Tax=Inhella proteolytica TaxID=2795029 RepID=A0A931J838_9BURK|nr:ShlB/FhaC/HecB family hemolysin secretion/activation protein [Inhella proteolytica]MBH9579284.1 ShlB/FhaC/HecB family hemolysin secretion/activation protein [Inhella proteolytica]
MRGTVLPLVLLCLLAVRPAAHAADSPPLQVQRFEVQGNTLLPAERIQARLAPFQGSSSVARLREAAAALQALYREAGYGGVVAFVPEQTLSGGVVQLRVVEGQLSAVEVRGVPAAQHEAVRARLPALQIGRTPEVRRLDAQIQLANENPAHQTQVLLQPGAQPGQVGAVLTVQQQPPSRWHARLDNSGGERTGRWRAALGWQHANFAGGDRVLSTEFQTAPEEPSAVKVFSAGLRQPFYASLLALDAYGAWSDVDGGTSQTAAGDLAFSGRGRVMGLRLSRYLERVGNVDQRLQVALEQRHYLNDCSIAGLPPGACGSAGASVRLQPLSLGYTAQAVERIRWGLHASLQTNLALGGGDGRQADFEAVRPDAKRRYALLRFGSNLGLPLDDWGSLELQLNGQLSPDALVPAEAFGLGGQFSVRGYEERELNGDSGLQASLEWWSPNWGARFSERWRLQGIVFADLGWARNRGSTPCVNTRRHCELASLGLGLRAGQGDTQLRLDVGVALKDALQTRRDDVHAHFSLQHRF